MRNYDRVRSVYVKVERMHHPKNNNNKGWVEWLTSVTLALGRLRQEDHYELDANFRYRVRPYLGNSDTSAMGTALSSPSIEWLHFVSHSRD